MRQKNKIFVMDLLCMTPYYDNYLCTALQKILPDLRLGAISFHLVPNFFVKHGVRRQEGVLDLVAKIPIRSRRVRQALKLFEYHLNLILLTVQFLFVMPDIIHIQWTPLATRIPVELWFLRFFQKRGTKLVYTVHNVLPHDSGDRYRDRFRAIYNMMDFLVCHTRQTQQQLIDTFAVLPAKTAIIPHGPLFHDAPAIPRQEARERLAVGEEQPLVLFFGLIRPYKGVEFLLEAWQAITANCPHAMLLIAGSGDLSYLDTIRHKVEELGLTDSVRLDFRYIPEEELSVFFQAADILVYPYRDVTQSGALLAGLSFGKPIVATNIGGFCEILNHGTTALLIDYGNCEQLATALTELINRPEVRARMSKSVYDEMLNNYSWKSIAEKTIACYHNVLEAK